MRGPDVLLVIEIADTSLGYDLARKASIYREHGVREYWVIDLNARQTHVHLLDGAWPRQPATPFASVLTPTLVPDLSIRIADLIEG